MIVRIDTKQLNSAIDLLDLASQYTELHRVSTREMAGPCPRCSGDDRFYVTAEWFACRCCHSKRGDAIEFVRWLHGCNFKEAIGILSDGKLIDPSVQQRAPKKSHHERNGLPTWAATRLANAQDRLIQRKSGAHGRAYLEGRGLLQDTWRAFGLGFDRDVSVPGTEGKCKAPAIAMPWYDSSGQLVAVRYRFLEVHDGYKQTAMTGSNFAGNLFGAHLLTVDPRMTLVLCEGEINAMSVWQVAAESRVDVLSLGSEGSTIPDQIIKHTAQYGAIVTWLDKEEHARRVASELLGARALKSVDGKDANDRLQSGELGGMIVAERLNFCQTEAHRLALLWDLYDGGLHAGLDAGTAAFVTYLATELRQSVTLREADGVWYTGRTAHGK